MREPDDDRVMIVCSPYSWENFTALPGNSIVMCENCDDAAVISTEGRAFAVAQTEAKLEVAIVCTRCAAVMEPEAPVQPVPGALERIERDGHPASRFVRRAIRGGMKARDFGDDDAA